MTFLEKLDYMMGLRGMNKNNLSQISGVPYTTIDGFYKKGYENTKMQTLRKLAVALDVSLDYLVQDDITDENYGQTSDFMVTLEEKITIKKYRDLDGHGKEVVDSVLDLESKRMERKKLKENEVEFATEVIDIPTRMVPLPLQPASAGAGEYIDDETVDWVKVVDNKYTIVADYIMRVHGDSMEPEFYDGELLLVRDQSEIREGEIGIFMCNNERFVKIKDGALLKSLNPKYPDIKLNETAICKGRVLGKLEDDWVVTK